MSDKLKNLAGAFFKFSLRHYQNQTVLKLKKALAEKYDEFATSAGDAITFIFFTAVVIGSLLGAGLVLLPIVLSFCLWNMWSEESRHLMTGLILCFFLIIYLLVPTVVCVLGFRHDDFWRHLFGVKKLKKLFSLD